MQDVFITQMNIFLGPSLNCHSSFLCLFIVVLILIMFPSLVFFVSGFDYVLSRLIKVYFRLFSVSLYHVLSVLSLCYGSPSLSLSDSVFRLPYLFFSLCFILVSSASRVFLCLLIPVLVSSL